MCGRFDTSLLTWKEIHAQLSGFAPVKGDASNMLAPNPDVRPTTEQLVARLEDGAVWLDPAQDATGLMAAVRPERFEVAAV